MGTVSSYSFSPRFSPSGERDRRNVAINNQSHCAVRQAQLMILSIDRYMFLYFAYISS